MYLILGFGKSGQGVAKYLKSISADFFIYDDNPPQNSQYNFCNSFPDNISFVIASPGFSTKYEPIHFIAKIAKEKSIPIISDIQFFMEQFPQKKYIGITGTNGKSTTTTLVYDIFKKSGKNVAICGNIGISPFADENCINADICIMEISSFQLEITHNVLFEISAITNITPDHLNRYHTMENYENEKFHIGNLSKTCIINNNIKHNFQNNFIPFSAKNQINGYFFERGSIFLQKNEICKIPQPKTQQNKENILTSFAICHHFGIEVENICKAIEEFSGIEHRVEFVKTIENIEFYNDSKATNIDSTLNALEILKEKNIFLIAGGILVDDLSNVFEKEEFKNIKMVAIIGQDAGKIKQYIQKTDIKHFLCGSIEKAVPLLFNEAKKCGNSIILLSPFCKSFDQFKNFEERGTIFKQIISTLT